MLKKIIMSTILALLLSGYAFAFGMAAKENTAHIGGNETAKFTLLFWGNNESIELWVKEAPQGWAVDLDTNNLTLKEDYGEEYISTGDGYARAKLVFIDVKPENSLNGNVLIGVRLKNEREEITFLQESHLILTVSGNEKAPIKETPIPGPINNSQENPQGGGEHTYLMIAAVAIIAIIAASFIIYKKS